MVDQVKIGGFLKELRKEKGLTQEDLAERLGLSSRSVSRWETGTTMPDLSMLVELAAFYEIDVKEIIDGERKSEITEKENKETLRKVADYAKNEKKLAVKQRRMITFAVCTIVFAFFLVMSWFSGQDVGKPIGEFIYHLTH